MEMELFDSIWKLSKESEYTQNRQKLTALTEELIQLYEGQGRLSDNPLTPSRERSLSLPLDRVAPVIKNKICLITGGFGCVGSALIKELVKFDPKLIVIVDIKDIGENVYQVPLNEKIVYEKCSILDFSAISGLFDAY
jgi:FlaA1/EpsC-like NDP-sugar epimerase